MSSDFKAAMEGRKAKKGTGGSSSGLLGNRPVKRTVREPVPRAHKSDPQFHRETRFDWRGRPTSSWLVVREPWWKPKKTVDPERIFAHMEEHEGVDHRDRLFHQGAERARGHAEETAAILASEPPRWRLDLRADRALRARDARGAAKVLGTPLPENLPPPLKEQRAARRAARRPPPPPRSGIELNGVPIEELEGRRGRRPRRRR